MKKIVLISIITLNSIFNYAQTSFERSYGGSGNDSAACIQQISDGGFIVCGSTNSFGAGGYDIYVTRLSSLGVKIWTKTFGGSGADYGNSIKQTVDGGYIIAGSSNSSISGKKNAYILRLNSMGDVIWSETIGSNGFNQGNDIIETTDGGFVVTGFAIDSIGQKSVHLIKTAANGTGVFETFIAYEGEGKSVLQTPDGGYIISASINNLNVTNNILIKTDSIGNKTWCMTYNGNSDYINNSLMLTQDGGYALGGSSINPFTGSACAYLIKINSGGIQQWTNLYNAGTGNSIKETSDQGFVITGSYISQGFSTIYLTKTDSFGITLWTKILGHTNATSLSLQQTADEGYVIAGLETTPNDGNNIYVIKTLNDGTTNCSDESVVFSENSVLSGETSFTFQTLLSTSTPNIQVPAVSLFSSMELTAGTITNILCSTPVSMISAISAENLVVDDSLENEDSIVQKSFQENDRSLSFNVFPNPNDGVNVNMSFESAAAEEILVVVYDQLGREHYSKIIVAEENSNNVFAIDPKGNLLPGIYMVTATSGKETFSKRLIVK